MGGITLDFSKAQPIPSQGSGVTLDFSKAQPINAPPYTGPAGGVLRPAPPPTIMERLRGPIANSAIGYALEQGFPKIADALNLHPTETVNSPTYQSDRQNLVVPQYLMPGNPQSQQAQKTKALLTGVGNLTNPKVPAIGVGIGAGATLAAPLAPVAIPAALALGGIGLGGTSAIRDASHAQSQYDQGNVDAGSEAFSNIPGDLLMMLGSGKIKRGSQPTIAGQNYTPSHAAAFEGLTAKANGMGPNFIPQNLTPDALSPIRQSAADMLANGNPTEQAIARAVTAKATAPLDRLGAVHNVVQKSLSDLEAQHAPVLSQFSQNPVDMTPIQRGLQGQIKPGMSAADIAGINDLIERSGQIQNLGDLNSFRQIMNEEASPSYRQTPTRAGQASAPQQVATDAANAVRAHYFDQMKQASGIDFQPLKNQESQLLTTKEAIERMQSPEAKAEATFNAPSTLRESAGNLANLIKEPRATVTQTILRESPATRASMLIRKSLSNLPEATPQGPRAPVPSNAPQLPANASPQNLTPQPPAPGPSPQPLLGNPQGQLPAAAVQSLLEQSAQPLALPADTNAMNVAQSPSTQYPPLNADTARTRIAPTQFATPPPVTSTGARPVTPSGQVLTPLQRFLQAGDLGNSIVEPSTDDLKRAIQNMRRRRGK